MEFFGLRMPLSDIATPTRTTVSFYASLAFEIPSSIQNKMAIPSQRSQSLVNVLSALWSSGLLPRAQAKESWPEFDRQGLTMASIVTNKLCLRLHNQ